MKQYFALALLLFYMNGTSQEYYNDARLWVNVYLEKELNKKVIVHFNQKDRFSNNISRFELAYGDVGLTYKFNKNIKVLADYVFAIKQKQNNSFGYRHQFYAAIILSKQIRRWKLMYRNLFQVSYKNMFTSPEGLIPRYYDRNKFTVRYQPTKRFSFYAAEELYIFINDPVAKGFSRSRSFAGMFIHTTRHQQLELYFCFQDQLQNANRFETKNSYPNSRRERNYIYGIGYSFEL